MVQLFKMFAKITQNQGFRQHARLLIVCKNMTKPKQMSLRTINVRTFLPFVLNLK